MPWVDGLAPATARTGGPARTRLAGMRTICGFGKPVVGLVSRLLPRRSSSPAGFSGSATATTGRPADRRPARPADPRRRQARPGRRHDVRQRRARRARGVGRPHRDRAARRPGNAGAAGSPGIAVGLRLPLRLAAAPGAQGIHRSSGRRRWARRRGGWWRGCAARAGGGPLPGADGRRPVTGRPDRRHRRDGRRAGGRAAGAAAGRLVRAAPLLPRALRARATTWHVYEPTSGRCGRCRPTACAAARWPTCSASTGCPPCSCRRVNAVGRPS